MEDECDGFASQYELEAVAHGFQERFTLGCSERA
jgi:hypothetical protein